MNLWRISALTSFLLLLCVSSSSSKRKLILGGINVHEKFNFMVGLRAKLGVKQALSENICGGALITSFLVITAAHCLFENNISVAAIGSPYNAKSLAAEYIEINKTIIYPDFDFKSIEKGMDIAILVLSRPSQLGTLVELPTEDSLSPPEGTPTLFLGWGRIRSSVEVYAPILKEVELTIVENSNCKAPPGDDNYHQISVLDNQLCAAAPNTGICDGDSGSPLLLVDDGIPTIIGIDSFGIKKTCGVSSEVFTRVHTFLPFIKSIIDSYSSIPLMPVIPSLPSMP